ncbi:hypothetical protein SAMN05192583_1339 [Sphingomonas gellani]|uniref:Uncharacterized protein n=1 Tax=Sphingomonas gellani TaxID=1166340 RepID=A0A1H8BF08_9SPHN|nr:hypothetical protein [Sphingomonas gellani]SEM81392.1 hypothetical protein SAMN05192583_1339 [Sphingomonas gellani]
MGKNNKKAKAQAKAQAASGAAGQETKLPKDILGIRIPKDLREIGGALLDKANSPQGREMLAAGLTMAAAAASAAVANGKAKREAAGAAGATPAGAPKPASPPAPPAPPAPPSPPSPPAPPQGTHTQPDPQAIAEAVGKAAEAMLGRLFGAKKA